MSYKIGDILKHFTGRDFIVTNIVFTASNPADHLYELTALSGPKTIVTLSKSDVDHLYTRVTAQTPTSPPPIAPTPPASMFKLGERVQITNSAHMGLFAGLYGDVIHIAHGSGMSGIEYVVQTSHGAPTCLEHDLKSSASTPPAGKFSAGDRVHFKTVPTEEYEVMSKGLVSNSNKLGYWIAKPTTPAVVVWAEESELTSTASLSPFTQSAVAAYKQSAAAAYKAYYETVDLDFLPDLGLLNPTTNIHKDHEIITNEALGKKFRYCRTCKIEV